MRIVAGRFKGRRLAGPGREAIRPTSDRLRETLFNVLGQGTEGLRVLDGFAGTGALGLEALSRGASHVTFVDRSPAALAIVQSNLEHCGATDLAELVRADFDRLPGHPRWRDMGPFDLILLDPPYDRTDLEGPLTTAAALLGAGGRLVLEHARRVTVPEQAGGLERSRLLEAGDSALSFYG